MSAEEQGQQIPPEVTILRPSFVNVIKGDDGAVQLEFMITPFKVVAVVLPAEGAKGIASQINSGIVVASGIPS